MRITAVIVGGINSGATLTVSYAGDINRIREILNSYRARFVTMN